MKTKAIVKVDPKSTVEPCGYMVYERSDPKSKVFVPSLRNGHWAICPTLLAAREAALVALAEAFRAEIPYTADDIAIATIYRDTASSTIFVKDILTENYIRGEEWTDDSTGTYD